MDDITLKRKTVTAFGIQHLGSFWWHDDLAERVGETVFVARESFPGYSLSAPRRLNVFSHSVDRICEATELKNPRRLLRSFERGTESNAPPATISGQELHARADGLREDAEALRETIDEIIATRAEGPGDDPGPSGESPPPGPQEPGPSDAPR